MKVEKYLVVKTGLHIGGVSEYEIGAIDNVVVKDSEEFPYIPGSSLKGKIRSLIETTFPGKLAYLNNDVNKEEPCSCEKCVVCKTFGFSKNKSEKKLIGGLIFRDAYIVNELDEEKRKEIKKKVGFEPLIKEEDSINQDFIEVKFENTIDRYKGTSTRGLRQTERVKPGTVFKIEIVIRPIDENHKLDGENKNKIREIYEELFNKKLNSENDEEYYKALVEIGLKLLEDDYLGGHGTRGYGSVVVLDK